MSGTGRTAPSGEGAERGGATGRAATRGEPSAGLPAATAANSAAAPGWGRALVAAYAFMALAACARSGVQVATRFQAAPLAFSLSAASGAIYLLAAVALSRRGGGWWRLGTGCCSLELAGVLAIGTWSLLDPVLFPEPTVWSGFGSGYGCVPLALPLLGLAYQRRRAPREVFARPGRG